MWHKVKRIQNQGSPTNPSLTGDKLSSCQTNAARYCVYQHLQLMKMDVEGWEYNILQGASRLLLHHHVWYIIAEASRGIIGEDGAYRLLSLLVAHGYSVSNTGFRGPWIQQADTDKRSVPNEQ
jgi:hypothetical protein